MACLGPGTIFPKQPSEMSKLQRECNELLELAKRTNDESVFQQKHHYKKFKAKTKAQDYDTLGELVTGLCDIGGFQLLDLIVTELKSHMTC